MGFVRRVLENYRGGRAMNDVVIHGLELVINDRQISEEHKKFLTYLKELLEEEE